MKNSEIGGLLIIDKPESKSSSFIDRVCKKILNIKKIGHIGTLDPFATGGVAYSYKFRDKNYSIYKN